MAFSGGVKLGDLDDFINPSQDCVKPLIEAAGGGGSTFKLDSSVTEAKARPAVEEVQVQKPNLIKSKVSKEDPKAQIGQVTLSDCLACSGCVTSAETVLLQEQSGDEFRKKAATSPLTVVTITAQAIASLAVASEGSGASMLETLQKLSGVLRQLGATYVLDSSAAEAVALMEGRADFVNRFKEAQKGKAPRNGLTKAKSNASTSSTLPLLTSHCPGWTCYAEKVVDPVIIPHISALRPPQQIQGRLVKSCLLEAHNKRRLHRWWRSRSPLFAMQCGWWLKAVTKADTVAEAGCRPLAPSDVYHVSVQPCFDRKIEAARPSFNLDGVREVDTILTTTELLDLAMHGVPYVPGAEEAEADHAEDPPPNLPPTPEAAAEALAALTPLPMDSEVLTDLLLQDLQTARPGRLLPTAVEGNGGSGGFAEYVFREAARDLFQMEVASPLVFKAKQNEDIREVTLEDPKTKKVLLRFLAAYGFRNIQNVIRRVTKDKGSEDISHYVEIMACPGGCLNGGGQIPEPKKKSPEPAADAAAPPPEAPQRRQRLGTLEAAYHAGEGVAVTSPAEHPLVPELYSYIASKGKTGGKVAKGTNGHVGVNGFVGSAEVKSWLAAEWKSLKVDDAGNEVLGASALKW